MRHTRIVRPHQPVDIPHSASFDLPPFPKGLVLFIRTHDPDWAADQINASPLASESKRALLNAHNQVMQTRHNITGYCSTDKDTSEWLITICDLSMSHMTLSHELYHLTERLAKVSPASFCSPDASDEERRASTYSYLYYYIWGRLAHTHPAYFAPTANPFFIEMQVYRG